MDFNGLNMDLMDGWRPRLTFIKPMEIGRFRSEYDNLIKLGNQEHIDAFL